MVSEVHTTNQAKKGTVDLVKAMRFIYKYYQARGVGSVVSIIGHTDQFKNDTIKAWHTMLLEDGLSTEDSLPVLQDNRHVTDKGVRLEFKLISDDLTSLESFRSTVSLSNYVCLFSEYRTPIFKGFLKSQENLRILSSFVI